MDIKWMLISNSKLYIVVNWGNPDYQLICSLQLAKISEWICIFSVIFTHNGLHTSWSYCSA